MPAKVNVNMRTVVHAGSNGIASAFPDVCKTPTPGGPVPIPYPNISQSSDTSKGSSTVKMDGNPIMLKDSEFKMSSGDEAGSADGQGFREGDGLRRCLRDGFRFIASDRETHIGIDRLGVIRPDMNGFIRTDVLPLIDPHGFRPIVGHR